jgi:hypothetical protein
VIREAVAWSIGFDSGAGRVGNGYLSSSSCEVTKPSEMHGPHSQGLSPSPVRKQQSALAVHCTRGTPVSQVLSKEPIHNAPCFDIWL